MTQEIKNLKATEVLLGTQALASQTQAGLNSARALQTSQQSRVLSGPAQVGDWLERIGAFVEQGGPNVPAAIVRMYKRARSALTDLMERVGTSSAGAMDRMRDEPLNIYIRKGQGE